MGPEALSRMQEKELQAGASVLAQVRRGTGQALQRAQEPQEDPAKGLAGHAWMGHNHFTEAWVVPPHPHG